MSWAHQKRESGQAAVELALVLPVLCLILFGILQFGLVMAHQIETVNAARAAGRVASISRDALDPVGAAVQAGKDNFMIADGTKATVTVTPSGPWESGDEVTVTVTYPFNVPVIDEDGTLTATNKVSIE